MSQLFSGTTYLESLDDGRNVYIDGQKITKVTNHPAFRNTALSLSRMYDALYDPQLNSKLLGTDDYGTITHKFFKPSKNSSDLLEAREAISTWLRMGYGFLGRTPDYKGAFMSGLAANANYYGPYAENAFRWYRSFTQKALYLNHVIINPPLNRKKPIHEMRNEFIHVVRETKGGIIVSGSKMLATGSALTHASFVAPVASTVFDEGKSEDFALVFFVKMNNPNVHLICRKPYGLGTPFDKPLSSRFDENDAVFILDEAFIPWDDILVYRDIKRATQFYAQSGFAQLYNFQSAIRMTTKLEFITGLFAKLTRNNGTDEYRGIQAATGELLAMRNLIWSLSSAMAYDTEMTPGGYVVPRLETASAMRVFNSQIWTRVRDLFATHLGGSTLLAPSGYEHLNNPHLHQLIQTYYQGADSTAIDRIQLLKLAWDALSSDFGGRDELYERNFSGNADQVRLDTLKWANQRDELRHYENFVQTCLDDYDQKGWRNGPWYNEERLSCVE